MASPTLVLGRGVLVEALEDDGRLAFCDRVDQRIGSSNSARRVSADRVM